MSEPAGAPAQEAVSLSVYPLQSTSPYRTNCYLAVQGADAVLIDASIPPRQLQPLLQRHKATLRAILLTHAHADHTEQLAQLRDAFAAPVYLDAREGAAHLRAQAAYGEAPLAFGALRLQPIYTPGHTMGSTCLVCGGVLFCGDTLFAGSMGRTDLPGGDERLLYASLRRLAALVPDEAHDLAVLPGHGEATTLWRERQLNPYVRLAMRGA